MGGGVAGQDDGQEAVIEKTDQAERLECREASPRDQGDYQEKRRQPQSSRQLTTSQGLVSLGLQDQLPRQALVGVEGSEDRVHAPPFQAPEVASLGEDRKSVV